MMHSHQDDQEHASVEWREVLILVVMDDALALLVNEPHVKLYWVLILVVMDDALAPVWWDDDNQEWFVLILVVMDDALAQIVFS